MQKTHERYFAQRHVIEGDDNHQTIELERDREGRLRIDLMVSRWRSSSELASYLRWAAEEVERFTPRDLALVDLLRSAHAIADRKGEDTAWETFAASIKEHGIGSVTARTFRLPVVRERAKEDRP